MRMPDKSLVLGDTFFGQKRHRFDGAGILQRRTGRIAGIAYKKRRLCFCRAGKTAIACSSHPAQRLVDGSKIIGDQIAHDQKIVTGIYGDMPEAGRNKDLVPRLCGDSDYLFQAFFRLVEI